MKKFILFFWSFAFYASSSGAQTVTDIDGNVYNTVTIGTQIWMKENLQVTHFRNGVAIPKVLPNWSSLTTPAYCNYNNDTNLSLIYGKLYNWYAVADSQNICPANWHVPSDGDWNRLELYLDNSVDTSIVGYSGTSIGNQLKEAGTGHWDTGNMATNSSNFTALPGGTLLNGASMASSILILGGWWSSTPFDQFRAQCRNLHYSLPSVFAGWASKKVGFSVRCIKDLTTQIKDPEHGHEMQLYPNPGNGKFTVSSPTEYAELIISNQFGQQIFTQKLNAKLFQFELIERGVYYVALKTAETVIRRKLIVCE